jgi:hypothetical protein
MRGLSLLLCAALIATSATTATGCWGYNSSSKNWAYAGNTLLIAGGAAAITADILTHDRMECPANQPPGSAYCSDFRLPFGGTLVAGALLLTAGIVGIVVNATRPTVKSSR